MTNPSLVFPLRAVPHALASCGETFTEVASRNQSELDALRADLKKLGELVAVNPPAKEPASPLDPFPVYKDDDEAG